ncbi:12653_t:CDS:2, partial [Gigaspora margarita]
MSINDSSSSNLLEFTSAKHKANKAKRANQEYRFGITILKVKTMSMGILEQVAVIVTKENDNIRRRWLIEVAKRGKKVNNDTDNEIPIRKKKPKQIDQLYCTTNLLITYPSTISLDGWTSPRSNSLYAFIITTLNCHEYLYALANYSGEHQTKNFIANKILDIIKNIVTDLVKAISIKKILKQANILIVFFQKSHLASRLLHDTILSMNIKGRSLETYSKTRMLEEKPNIFTNQEVFQIICDKDNTFYTLCKRISLIFKPIKRVITLLKSHIANLADCFIGIVQIAIALKRISASNNFRTLAIVAFNFRYQQFDISPYLLTYYLYPNYRNKDLKNKKILDIGEIAVNYYKKAHYNDKECHRLISQLIKYKARAKPWNLEYFSYLTSSLYFSILKWFTEGHHIWLQVPQLESMAQLHSFYISNVEKELKLHNFVEMELHNMDLLDPIFGADNNNQVEPILTEEETKETSMEFE